jgi:hypothetical protein
VRAHKPELPNLGEEAVPGGIADIMRAVDRARDARSRFASGGPRRSRLFGAIARLMGKDRALR